MLTEPVTDAISNKHKTDAISARSSAVNTSSRQLRVVHFQRKPFVGQHSIEALFANLRDAMGGLGLKAVPAVLPYHSKGLLRRLADLVWAARNQGDVNHITGDVHFLALGLRGQRTILTIHDCHALERLSGLKRWILRKLWFDLPTRRAAAVTVISEETKRQLLRHVRVPEDKVVVIPDAAAAIFRPCPRPFNEDCPRILHIGTKANKNLPRLIEAVQGTSCRLTIIGRLDGSLRTELDRSGIAYDSAENLTEVQMYQAYCDADIVSFVSTYEGFGLPIIEAQWVERPVVTSNCSSMPEVAGEGACFVDPYDVESIRIGLERVIDDAEYREQLIEQGRKNRERFHLRAVAEQYIQLYRQLSNDSSWRGALN